MPDQITSRETLTIGRLSSLAEVDVATVRFYERSGLLEAQERTNSGYRLYSKNSLARVQFILRARETGYSLNQIKELLHLYDQGGSKQEIGEFVERMINEINEKKRRLTKWQELFTDISMYLERSDAAHVDGSTMDSLMRGQCKNGSH